MPRNTILCILLWHFDEGQMSLKIANLHPLEDRRFEIAQILLEICV